MKLLKSMVMGSMALLLGASMGVAAELKVAVVDMHKLLDKNPELVKVSKDLEKQFKPREEALQKLQKKMQAQSEKLERDASTMSHSEQEKLSNALAKGRREFYRDQQALHDDVSLAQHQAMQKIFEKVHHVIDDLAKSDGYDLVLQKYGLPYSNNRMDITDQVAKKLAA